MSRWREAIAIERRPEVLARLGRLCTRLGELHEAEELLLESIRRAPEVSDAHFYLGLSRNAICLKVRESAWNGRLRSRNGALGLPFLVKCIDNWTWRIKPVGPSSAQLFSTPATPRRGMASA